MRVKLRIAIVESRKSQRQIAAASHIPESRLSSIVHAWTDPRDTERSAIATALGRSVDEELFEVHEPAPAA